MIGALWGLWVWCAPPPQYGGEIEFGVSRTLVSAEEGLCPPWEPAAMLRQTLEREPLYDLQMRPVVARAEPRFEDGEWIIPVRTDIHRHDGERLSARDVETFLREAAGCLGLLPFLQGPPRQAIRAEPLLSTVRIRVRSPASPGLTRLLQGPLVSVGVPLQGTQVVVGTGPFRPDPTQEGRSLAFSAHRQGRPYLDGVQVTPLRRRPVPSPQSSSPTFQLSYWLVQTPADPDRLRRVDAALNRARLLRFVPHPAQPVGPVWSESEPAPEDRTPMALDLLLGSGTGSGFRERLQLDLYRAGLRGTLQTESRRRPQLELVASAHHSGAPGGAAAAALRLLGRLNRFSPGVADAVSAGALEGTAPIPWKALAENGVLPLMTTSVDLEGPDPRTLADHSLPREPPP